ncbi:MAG: fructokinase [Candidatus Pelagadaptatus aseana]|uniref:ROK family protein n=1 Tax=Candidatus Pelagadaptatus aseana TaxID=3120508 RepID=UPI0039B16CA5
MTGMFVGVDLGGTKTEVIVLNGDSEELLRRRIATAASYQDILAGVARLVNEAEQSFGVTGLPVGIGIPGSVSRVTGRVKNANTQCLNGQPLPEDLRQLLGRPIPVVNDANCLAVSEAIDGAGKGHGVVFAAILGTGCGAGIALDGRAMTGPNGLAGEWGHVPMPGVTDAQRQQRPCFCGQSGCVETFLSGTGLQQTYWQLCGRRETAAHIARLAQQGDLAAQDCLAIYRDQLLDGLTMIVNIIDPDIIVLGGGVANIHSLYSYLNQSLSARVFGGECHTRVVKACHGDSSGVRGAAWLNFKDKNI